MKLSTLIFGEPSEKSVKLLSESIAKRNRLDFNKIRTRLAPSPTGFLHMGSLATANINYMIAKTNGGEFIVRIEDTDQARKVEGATESIIRELNYFELSPDEGPGVGGDFGPYIQTERAELHIMIARELLDQNYIYPCFCTQEELSSARQKALVEGNKNYTYDNIHSVCDKLSFEEIEKNIRNGKSFVLRMKPIDIEYTKYPDLVLKNINITPNTQHPVLFKSNGIPTYIFAALVDDWLMGITHMYRGTDWQNQIPAHLQMWEILKRTFNIKNIPIYGHLPLILQPIQYPGDKSQKKLSKRTPGADVKALIEQGFSTYAIKAYLLSLANSAFVDVFKKMKLNERLEDVFVFNVNKVQKSPARFDFDLLKNMSAKVFARYPMEEKSRMLKDWIIEYIAPEAIEKMESNLRNMTELLTASKFDHLKNEDDPDLKSAYEKQLSSVSSYQSRIDLIKQIYSILDLKNLQFHKLFEIFEIASKRNDYSSFSDFVLKYAVLFKRMNRSANQFLYDKLFNRLLTNAEFVDIFKTDMKSVANLLFEADSVPSAYDVYVYSYKNRKND